ncbi:YheC/YheD family protein [Gorillibacterium sp. CAU 1737]|uniref:YheC/YheD family endospore coat-associated protein n=1 Tax=Gorillibacterium sp. CAU 1737 TaxID=3140362 RepID=UPI0032603760
MTNQKVLITHTSGSEEGVFYLGGTLAKKWTLQSGTIVTVKLGSRERLLKLVVEPKGSTLRLHPSAAGFFGLPSGIALGIRYQASSQTLQLGPVLAVLMRKITASEVRPFGNVTGFAQELTEAGKKLGVFVFFLSAEQLPGPSLTVQGWSYAGGSWRKGSFPYPDAVYNRITSRIIEKSPGVQNFFSTVKARTGKPVFNERYLNKAEVFEALRKEKLITAYLPQSIMLLNTAQVKGMLAKHAVVFLKPIMSSLGKGIIRISRTAKGYACLMATADGKVQHAGFSSQDALFAFLKKKMAGNRYLLQEGIDLIRVEGMTTDFRSLVQKGESGKWEITSIVARISAKHTFVSNLARGGKLMSTKDAIKGSTLPAPLHANAYEGLRQASIEIAEALERQVDGHFAELGIDLALDQRGRVRLIEINSKPSKDDNTPLGVDPNAAPPAGEVKIRPSVRRVLQYVRHMTQF